MGRVESTPARDWDPGPGCARVAMTCALNDCDCRLECRTRPFPAALAMPGLSPVPGVWCTTSPDCVTTERFGSVRIAPEVNVTALSSSPWGTSFFVQIFFRCVFLRPETTTAPITIIAITNAPPTAAAIIMMVLFFGAGAGIGDGEGDRRGWWMTGAPADTVIFVCKLHPGQEPSIAPRRKSLNVEPPCIASCANCSPI
jgi:hypothetical protein